MRRGVSLITGTNKADWRGGIDDVRPPVLVTKA